MKVKTYDESCCLSYGSTKSNDTNSVRFSNISFREYPINVGDNPACSSGTPISIDWDYYPSQGYKTISIDDYEESRPRRRNRLGLRIPHEERHRMLREDWGVPLVTILETATKVKRIRMQRRRTAIQPDALFVAEDLVESTFRKWKRIVRSSKGDDVPSYIKCWDAEKSNPKLLEHNLIEYEPNSVMIDIQKMK